MKQSQTAHSGLQTFGRVIGFFLLFIFILVVPIYVVLFGVTKTLLSETYLERHLTDGNVRTEALAIVQNQLSSVSSEDDSISNSQKKAESNVAESPEVSKILSKAVSESTFNTVVDTALSNTFAFLNGKKNLADISIKTSDLQKNVLAGLQSGVTELPVCGPKEVSIFDQESENTNTDTASLCKPAGVSDAELVKFAKDPQFTKMITENVPSTLKLSDLPNFEDINYQAKQVQHYYTQLVVGMMFGGIALVLALILGSFLWHQHVWYGLQTLGITLFVPLATISGLALFGDMFISRLVANNALSQDPVGMHVIAIGWYLVEPMIAFIAEVSLVGAGAGLIMFIVMEVIRHTAARKGMAPEVTPVAPKAPKSSRKRA